MARFGFVGPSYQSQSVNADAQLTMNWYPEIIESGQGASGMALYPTPGLKSFFPSGDPGPTRGLYTMNGRSFMVSANNVYEVGALGTSLHAYAASVANDAQPVSFAGGPNQLLIASGGNAYVIDLTANTLTLIPAGTLTNVSMVAYIDGFFLALIKNSNQIFASTLLDATSWPGLSTTKVSVFTDNVISIFADHRELAVAGPRASQVYFDSGNFPFPLDIIPGAFIEQGIAAQFSIVKIDNSVFWLGADERGQGIVWRMQGYNPVRISNHAIELAIQSYARMDDAVAFSYQDQGHSFYWLSFPTAQKTWVYDVATNMWHERGFWNTQVGVFNQHRAQYHTFNFGKHLVGGTANGTLYDMSIAYLNDFENPIRRVRRAPHISNEKEWMFHSQLQVDFETGLGTFFDAQNFPWFASEQGAFAINGASVYGKLAPLGGFQGEVASALNYFPGADQFAECTITAQNLALGTGNFTIGPAVRMTIDQASGLISCYAFEVRHDGFYQLVWETNCPPGQQFSSATDAFIRNSLAIGGPAPQIGDVLRIEVVGNQVTAKLNGAILFGPIVDNRIATGQPGLEAYPEDATLLNAFQVSNFNAGPLPGVGQSPSFAGIGDFHTNQLGINRGPQAMLRWSDDGGHSWSNLYNVDCGQTGEYTKRAIWRRLGRSRERVYELSVTDAVPWRVVDAFLQAEPGFQPTERLVHQYRKSA